MSNNIFEDREAKLIIMSKNVHLYVEEDKDLLEHYEHQKMQYERMLACARISDINYRDYLNDCIDDCDEKITAIKNNFNMYNGILESIKDNLNMLSVVKKCKSNNNTIDKVLNCKDLLLNVCNYV